MWHASFPCALRLFIVSHASSHVHRDSSLCDMTYSHVHCDSVIVCHASFPCALWLFNIRNASLQCALRLVLTCHVSFVYVLWLIIIMLRDVFLCVPWLILTSQNSFSYVQWPISIWHVSLLVCTVTHSDSKVARPKFYVERDSFVRDVTHSYA